MLNLERYLQGGRVNREEFPFEEATDSISLSLGKNTGAWRVRLYAQGGRPGEDRSGYVYAGSVRVYPWTAGMDRFVAFASVPGARRWAVDGAPEDHNNTEKLRVNMIGCPQLGDLGVTAVPGVSLANPRHHATLTGVSGGLTVPGKVWGYTCVADVTGATVSLIQPGDTLPTVIVVPPGESLSDTFGDTSGDFVTFIFTGTLSYVIDYEVPGAGLDSF